MKKDVKQWAKELLKDAADDETLPKWLCHEVYLGAIFINKARTAKEGLERTQKIRDSIGNEKGFYAMIMSQVPMIIDLAEQSPTFEGSLRVRKELRGLGWRQVYARAREQSHPFLLVQV